MTILALWAVFLAGRTFLRNPDWHDQRTFLERTIADGGDSARMLINLGGLELTEGHARLANCRLPERAQSFTGSPFRPYQPRPPANYAPKHGNWPASNF